MMITPRASWCPHVLSRLLSFLQSVCLDIPDTRLQRATGRTLCWTWTESPLSIPTMEDLTTTSSITIIKISTRTSSHVSCDCTVSTSPALPDSGLWSGSTTFSRRTMTCFLFIHSVLMAWPTTRPDKLPVIRWSHHLSILRVMNKYIHVFFIRIPEIKHISCGKVHK